MIDRLLVANRGEIARRIFRTCRDLGISTAAVFSDPDTGAPHVAEADVSVRLRGAAPSETYLRGDLLIKAAKAADADAIHPGYGFLSENADFARAVIDAGLTWIGPPAEAIASMGSKIEAKKIMAEAGVPVLPELDPCAVAEFPVLIKASAGGGGRGMRIVTTREDLDQAVVSARREAESAFGDPTVFCEPLVVAARHIEVQVLADQHGTVWALGERECSIQRRHQKIVEEAPSPAVSPSLRSALCKAAVAAAKAIGYVGAGTVEFLLDPAGDFYFLEMNTRLQVEHPVTEYIYGLDLVRSQIEVAEGCELRPEPPVPAGHAIEARLYAEDPAADWRPSSGVLHTFEVPPAKGVRLDSGVVSGSEVGVHYDPMLAKVISYGTSRAQAVRRLDHALTKARIHGLITNRELLVAILRSPAFQAGDTDTGFLERHDLSGGIVSTEDVHLSALAAALAQACLNRANARVLSGLSSGWRNVPSQPQRVSYDGGIEIAYRITRDGLVAEDFPGVGLVSAEPYSIVLDVSGVRRGFRVAAFGDQVYVDSDLGPVSLVRLPRFADPRDQIAPGSLLAPMPGTVVRVAVGVGDAVELGQPLVVLEAMKMEHQIVAPTAGTVTALNVEAGGQVDAGAVLAIIV